MTPYPFFTWFFGPIGSGFTHTLKDLPESWKDRGSNLAHHHKDRIITHHKDGVFTCHTDIITKMG